MPARLIINADDFGLTQGINRAVAELFDAGAITSATLMACGPAFDDAVAIARSRPTLGIGCHIVLTDGTPISPPGEIPSLLGLDGNTFRSSAADFFRTALLGRLSQEEIERETEAQIRRVQRAGLTVTHLDTHKHTHILPAVGRPLLRAAERTDVRGIRNPFEQRWSLCVGRPQHVRRLQMALLGALGNRFQSHPQIRSGAVRTTGGTLGISATGRLDRDTLQRLLAAIPAGVWELVCHPGYNDRDLDRISTRLRAEREIELRALLSTFGSGHASENDLKQPRPELIHYGQLCTASHRGSIPLLPSAVSPEDPARTASRV